MSRTLLLLTALIPLSQAAFRSQSGSLHGQEWGSIHSPVQQEQPHEFGAVDLPPLGEDYNTNSYGQGSVDPSMYDGYGSHSFQDYQQPLDDYEGYHAQEALGYGGHSTEYAGYPPQQLQQEQQQLQHHQSDYDTYPNFNDGFFQSPPQLVYEHPPSSDNPSGRITETAHLGLEAMEPTLPPAPVKGKAKKGEGSSRSRRPPSKVKVTAEHSALRAPQMMQAGPIDESTFLPWQKSDPNTTLLQKEWRERGLYTPHTARQVAAHVAEMKIKYPDVAYSLTRAASIVVKYQVGEGDQKYLKAYSFWTTKYTTQINKLRKAVDANHPEWSAEEKNSVVLANLHVNMPEEPDEEVENSIAEKVWNRFYRDRLGKALQKEPAMSMLMIARESLNYTHYGYSPKQTLKYIKRYLEKSLHVPVDEIAQITQLQQTQFTRYVYVHDDAQG